MKKHPLRAPGAIAAQVDQIMAASRARFGHGQWTMHGNAVLARMEEERKSCIDFIDRTLAEVEKPDADGKRRDLSASEKESLAKQRDRVKELDEQIKPLREFEELRTAHDDTTSQYVPTRDGGADSGTQPGQAHRLGTEVRDRTFEYRSAGEFIVDSIRASGRGNCGSREQIDGATDRLRGHGFTVEAGELIRAAAPHNTTAEVPGLLPATIVGGIMSDVDAARPFVSSVGAQDLGGIPGTTFSRPTITQHVEVAKQTAEKAELADGQFKVGSVPFTKDTYGGWANVARQSIDWTSPAVWNALMTDFIEQYGLQTEDAAANAFVTAVVAKEELPTASGGNPSLNDVLAGLYGAAKKAYQGSGRMPDTIWCSLDWWTKLSVMIDQVKANTAGNGGGDSSLTSFAGNLLATPRVVVPSFPTGTLIVGVKSRTEVYEDRIGFLSAVEPSVLGVRLAYGGYMASGTIKPAAFCKIVNES